MKGINLNKKYTKFIFIFILIILLIGGYKVYTRYKNKIIDYKQTSIHIDDIEKRLSGESEKTISLGSESKHTKIRIITDATGNTTYQYTSDGAIWKTFTIDQRIPKPQKDDYVFLGYYTTEEGSNNTGRVIDSSGLIDEEKWNKFDGTKLFDRWVQNDKISGADDLEPSMESNNNQIILNPGTKGYVKETKLNIDVIICKNTMDTSNQGLNEINNRINFPINTNSFGNSEYIFNGYIYEGKKMIDANGSLTLEGKDKIREKANQINARKNNSMECRVEKSNN